MAIAIVTRDVKKCCTGILSGPSALSYPISSEEIEQQQLGSVSKACPVVKKQPENSKMSKEMNVERAKLAEQAERYDDMAQVRLQARALKETT